MSQPPDTSQPSFAEAARFWIRLGFVSFGGPAGQIAILHREVVERRRWLGEREFTDALNFCMLLPGPEALQLAIYLGWKLHGIRGGLVAGLGFIGPAIVLLLGLSWLYARLAACRRRRASCSASRRRSSRWCCRRWCASAGARSAGRCTSRSRSPRSSPSSGCGVPFPLIVLAAGLVGLASAWRAPKPTHHDDGCSLAPGRRSRWSPPACCCGSCRCLPSPRRSGRSRCGAGSTCSSPRPRS